MFGKPITVRPATNTGTVVNNTTVVTNTTVVDNRYYSTEQYNNTSTMTPTQWAILINDTHALR